jgi:hypothetical protein
MSVPLTELELKYIRATHHVAEGRRIVAEQCQRIVKRQLQGYPIAAQEHVLWLFVRTLESLEHYERTLSKEIADAQAELAKHDD